MKNHQGKAKSSGGMGLAEWGMGLGIRRVGIVGKGEEVGLRGCWRGRGGVKVVETRMKT